MKLSVVIPTHNRAEVLKECLKRLLAQKDVDFEIVVVDDGSVDDTKDVFASADFSTAVEKTQLRYIYQTASHQGVARNNGVLEANGEVIVFIGDDIFVEPGFLKHHHDVHINNPGENVVVLGHTTWDPSLEINDYMKFLESSGWQFGYHLLEQGLVTHLEPFKFFYTSNISIKRSMLQKEKFSDKFQGYGWEDIELGYRLFDIWKMELYYEPNAKGLHHHVILESDLPKRMNQVGKAAVNFQKIQTGVSVVPSFFKQMLITVIGIFTPILKLLNKNLYYKVRSWKEFMKGVNNL